MAVRVQVLGAVRAWHAAGEAEKETSVGGPKARAVLAVLALAAGRPVSRTRSSTSCGRMPRQKLRSTRSTRTCRRCGAAAGGSAGGGKGRPQSGGDPGCWRLPAGRR
ncbi:hypothetical protein [Fodinicola feengrottensis]|uniref:hypothetical protein n=1 Tax=Fodinicola feengrottensis TaxID=435914 RepID=UPI0013D4DB34|nr:hypothetical protein [Fodinicola feengrottensis]